MDPRYFPNSLDFGAFTAPNLESRVTVFIFGKDSFTEYAPAPNGLSFSVYVLADTTGAPFFAEGASSDLFPDRSDAFGLTIPTSLSGLGLAALDPLISTPSSSLRRIIDPSSFFSVILRYALGASPSAAIFLAPANESTTTDPNVSNRVTCFTVCFTGVVTLVFPSLALLFT